MPLNTFNAGKLVPEQVVMVVCLAIMANSAFKFGLIVSLGGKELAKVCAPMFLIAVGAMFITAFVWA